MQSSFQLIDNELQMQQLDVGGTDGLKLNEKEKEYLLPHFLLIIVGKPGSGKTTVMKQLLTNSQMYHRKFDDVLMVSPSHAKCGIKCAKENTTEDFSLDWIFSRFDKFNDEQLELIFGNKTREEKKKPMEDPKERKPFMINDHRSRFLLSDAFASTEMGMSMQKKKAEPKDERRQYEKKEYMQMKWAEFKQMPKSYQEKTHRNTLLVLDDCVGSIKKAEYDPRLAQLVMNRRHVIFNGTVSIMMVTQKYTMIPARVRSNANWLILFHLNPRDFELAYSDAITMPQYQWRQLLHFIFGIKLKQNERYGRDEQPAEEQEEEEKDYSIDKVKEKKYANLGIWIESNVFFKDFKRIKI